MASNILKMLQTDSTPIAIVGKIIDDIAKAQQSALNDGSITKSEVKFSDTLYVGKMHNYRTWGNIKGNIIELDYGVNANGASYIRVKTEWDDYARGCHLGTYNELIEIPDTLVSAYEHYLKLSHSDVDGLDDNAPAYPEDIINRAWAAYNEKVKSYVADEIVQIKLKVSEAEAEARKQKADQAKENEKRERELLKSLQDKYPNS